jgi:flagellar basal body rod protein FlgC
MNPISTAASGLMAASTRFDAASNGVIAAGTGSNGDLAASLVDQIGAKTQFQASAGVLKTANDMFKTLLDITV